MGKTTYAEIWELSKERQQEAYKEYLEYAKINEVEYPFDMFYEESMQNWWVYAVK